MNIMRDVINGRNVQIKQWKGHDCINFQGVSVPLEVRKCPGHEGWFAVRPYNTFCKYHLDGDKYYNIARINDYFTLDESNHIRFYPYHVMQELKGTRHEEELCGESEPDSFDEVGNSVWNEKTPRA